MKACDGMCKVCEWEDGIDPRPAHSDEGYNGYVGIEDFIPGIPDVRFPICYIFIFQ